MAFNGTTAPTFKGDGDDGDGDDGHGGDGDFGGNADDDQADRNSITACRPVASMASPIRAVFVA